jgi:hypothetical protein
VADRDPENVDEEKRCKKAEAVGQTQRAASQRQCEIYLDAIRSAAVFHARAREHRLRFCLRKKLGKKIE